MTVDLNSLVLERGGSRYEAVRRAAVANGRTPDRYPAAIVLARSEEDVVMAVRLARQRGLRLSVRSGGHSWAGSHLREDGLLIDLSQLTDTSIDADAMRAQVQPGLRSSDLARDLMDRGLAFPTGHCTGPGIGGFTLQGGFGWNSRAVGPACMSLEAIDVVTADGELVRADAVHNEDLFWAARGSGPGFFGVVTRFHLRLHRRPAVCMTSAYLYPLHVMDEVFRWMREIGPQAARTMEPMVFMRRDLLGHKGPVLMVTGPVLADSEDQAREDLAILETCPVLDHALESAAPRFAHTDVAALVADSDDFYPAGARFAVDNMWTHGTADELLPGLHRIAETLPSSPSHMLWLHWGGAFPERPDMAFSLEDEVYIAVYGVSDDRADDAANAAWVSDRMREMEPWATGIQLADENLGNRRAPFLAPENMQRLQEIRAARDPEGLFHSWMGHDG